MTLIAKAAPVLGAGLGQPLAEAGRQCQCNRVSPVGVWGWLQSQCRGFPGSSGGKASTCHAGDPGLIPGSGRSHEGNDNSLQ